MGLDWREMEDMGREDWGFEGNGGLGGKESMAIPEFFFSYNSTEE